MMIGTPLISALAVCVGLLLPTAFQVRLASAEAAGPTQLAERPLALGVHVLAHDVVDRQPVGIADRFKAADQRVYSFVSVDNPGPPTVIKFRWFRNDEEYAVIEERVGTASAWRTWSSVSALPGSWRVVIESARGAALNEQAFEVFP